MAAARDTAAACDHSTAMEASLQQARTQTAAAHSKHTAEVQQLQQRLLAHREAECAARDEASALSEQVLELQEKLEEQTKARASAVSQARTSCRALGSAEEQLEAQAATIARLQSEADAAGAKVHSLQGELACAKKDNHEAYQTIASLRKQLAVEQSQGTAPSLCRVVHAISRQQCLRVQLLAQPGRVKLRQAS